VEPAAVDAAGCEAALEAACEPSLEGLDEQAASRRMAASATAELRKDGIIGSPRMGAISIAHIGA